MAAEPWSFADRAVHTQLAEAGKQAIASDDFEKLRKVVLQFYSIRISAGGDDMIAAVECMRELMAIDASLPVGHTTESGERFGRAVHGADDWPVFKRPEEVGSWSRRSHSRRSAELGLVDDGWTSPLVFGGERFVTIFSGADGLCPIVESFPESKNEALAFASALRATRTVEHASPLQDAIYVERLSRLLPTFSISSRVPDDVVFGAWFTGGVPVSIEAFRRIRSLSLGSAPST